MQRLLIGTDLYCSLPDRTAADLAAFTHQEIAGTYGVSLNLVGTDVDLGKCGYIDPIPLDIDIPEVRNRVLSGDQLPIKHLPKTLVISMAKSRHVPTHRHLPNHSMPESFISG